MTAGGGLRARACCPGSGGSSACCCSSLLLGLLILTRSEVPTRNYMQVCRRKREYQNCDPDHPTDYKP